MDLHAAFGGTHMVMERWMLGTEMSSLMWMGMALGKRRWHVPDMAHMTAGRSETSTANTICIQGGLQGTVP